MILPPPYADDYWVFRCNRGEYVAPDEIPCELFAEQLYPGLPEVMKISGGVVVVRERVKEVFEQFRLGRSHFVEVTISGTNRKSIHEGPFYIFNIAERRSIFCPEQSERAVQLNSGRWDIHAVSTFNLTVHSVPDDVDIWMDPDLVHGLFLSAPLAHAIKAAKIKNIKTYPCLAAV